MTAILGWSSLKGIAALCLGAALCVSLGGSPGSTGATSTKRRAEGPASATAPRTSAKKTTAAAAKLPVNPFLTRAMRVYLRGRDGDITAALYNFTDKTTYLYRPGIAEQTASIIKVDILATLIWEEQGSADPLGGQDQEVAEGMIEDSDDDDATELWNEAGGSQPVSNFDELVGMIDTAPNTMGYWGETTTTAADQIELLKHIVLPNSLLDNASRVYELGLMENVVGSQRWGVSTGPPASATVALKNGWVPIVADDWQVNSVGYINGFGRRYLIAVLTNGNLNESYGIDTIDGISRILWSELAPSKEPSRD